MGLSIPKYLFFNFFIFNNPFIFIKSSWIFEIILPNSFINYMGRLERQDSNRGYFLSGMFSTLMATPCSAPFLGTAIGFASLTSNLNIFLIFIFISFGFSIPYFFLILKPSLLHSLPKPGKWMIKVLNIFWGLFYYLHSFGY